MDPTKGTKKRRLTDKNLPLSLSKHESFASESQMYTDLLEMERKLDWTMTRKRVEVQDVIRRQSSTPRTLRIFISHTVSDQAWQDAVGTRDLQPNFETSEGIPAWQVKVEGRLLDLPNQRSKNMIAPPRKFTSFIRRMIVEMDRDPSLYPEENVVEWPKQTPPPALDGFTIRRVGDVVTPIRVLIYLDHVPERFKVHPDLGNILSIKEDSRMGVIQAMWHYIKINNLQDKSDRRVIGADENLKLIFNGAPHIVFAQIPELVNRYLMPPDPIILRYTVDPTVPPSDTRAIWDVEVHTEDVSLKSRMNGFITKSKESTRELAELDEEITTLAQSLHNSHIKHTFLGNFAADPSKFIQMWLASQSRDLENILGSGPSEGGTLRAEQLRRSEFFGPGMGWVEEAVAQQEGMRLAQKHNL